MATRTISTWVNEVPARTWYKEELSLFLQMPLENQTSYAREEDYISYRGPIHPSHGMRLETVVSTNKATWINSGGSSNETILQAAGHMSNVG